MYSNTKVQGKHYLFLRAAFTYYICRPLFPLPQQTTLRTPHRYPHTHTPTHSLTQVLTRSHTHSCIVRTWCFNNVQVTNLCTLFMWYRKLHDIITACYFKLYPSSSIPPSLVDVGWLLCVPVCMRVWLCVCGCECAAVSVSVSYCVREWWSKECCFLLLTTTLSA